MRISRKSSAYNIILVVLISVVTKIIGLVKQIVISYFYGMTGETDAFMLISGTINDIGTVLFSALAVVYLSDYIRIKKENSSFLNVFSTNVLVIFVSISLIVVLALEFFSPIFVGFLAPGFEGANYLQAVKYLKLLAPMIVLLCLRTFANSILDANSEYAYGKSLGVIQSSCLIIMAVFGYQSLGIEGLVYALIITYFIEVAIGFYLILKRQYYSIAKPNNMFGNDVRFLITCIVPLFISNSISEINAVVSRRAASLIAPGSLSALSYAQTLKQFVVSVLITSTLSVLYTNLTNKSVEGENKGSIVNYVLNSTCVYLLVLIPVTIITVFCRVDLVAIVYGHGAVSDSSVIETSKALLGYAFGFIPLAINGVLLRVYYSISNTKYPIFCNISCVFLNAVLVFLLSRYFGIVGISLASSISTFASIILLSFGVKKRFGRMDWTKLCPFLLKAVVSAVIASLVVFFVYPILGANPIIRLLIVFFISVVAFYVMILLLRCKEMKMIITFIKKSARRGK